MTVLQSLKNLYLKLTGQTSTDKSIASLIDNLATNIDPSSGGEPFIVDYYKDDGAWTTETSFEDIQDAYSDGKTIIARTNDALDNGITCLFNLIALNDDLVFFAVASYDLIMAIGQSSDEVGFTKFLFSDKQDAFRVGQNLSLNNGVLSAADKSLKIVSALPQSNIDLDTYYLTKKGKTIHNFGDYFSNDIDYPDECLPFSSISKGTTDILIYNSLDSKFYFVTFDTTDFEMTIKNTNVIHFYSGYAPSMKVYTYQPEVDTAWVEVYSSAYPYLKNYDISLSSQYKSMFVYTNKNKTITDQVNSTNYTLTYDSSYKDTSGYIYANFFDRTTGEYNGNDDNHFDISKRFIYNMNAYRNSAWSVVGEFDLQKLCEIFLQSSDIVQTTGQNTDKVMSQKATTDEINRPVKFAPELPVSNISQDTVYFVKKSKTVHNFGNYISDGVEYPTATLPRWDGSSLPNIVGALTAQSVAFLFYSSYYETFYLLVTSVSSGVTDWGTNIVLVEGGTMKISHNGNYKMMSQLYKFKPSTDTGWVYTYNYENKASYTLSLCDLNNASKTKFVWANVDIPFVDEDNNEYTLKASDSSLGSTDIFANFFTPSTGVYKDNDPNNNDESLNYVYELKKYNGTSWITLAEYDLTWLFYYLRTEAQIEALINTAVATKQDTLVNQFNIKSINGTSLLGSGDISTLHNYSTNEQVVGTWIDGRPVYEKTVVDTTNSISSNAILNIPHNIENFDFSVCAFGHCLYGDNNNQAIPITSNANSNNIGIANITSSTISLRREGNWSYNHRNFYITLQYTKTTDTQTN